MYYLNLDASSRCRQFVAPPPDARSLGRRSSVGRNTPRLNQAGKAGAVIEEMGFVRPTVILERLMLKHCYAGLLLFGCSRA